MVLSVINTRYAALLHLKGFSYIALSIKLLLEVAFASVQGRSQMACVADLGAGCDAVAGLSLAAAD